MNEDAETAFVATAAIIWNFSVLDTGMKKQSSNNLEFIDKDGSYLLKVTGVYQKEIDTRGYIEGRKLIIRFETVEENKSEGKPKQCTLDYWFDYYDLSEDDWKQHYSMSKSKERQSQLCKAVGISSLSSWEDLKQKLLGEILVATIRKVKSGDHYFITKYYKATEAQRMIGREPIYPLKEKRTAKLSISQVWVSKVHSYSIGGIEQCCYKIGIEFVSCGKLDRRTRNLFLKCSAFSFQGNYYFDQRLTTLCNYLKVPCNVDVESLDWHFREKDIQANITKITYWNKKVYYEIDDFIIHPTDPIDYQQSLFSLPDDKHPSTASVALRDRFDPVRLERHGQYRLKIISAEYTSYELKAYGDCGDQLRIQFAFSDKKVQWLNHISDERNIFNERMYRLQDSQIVKRKYSVDTNSQFYKESEISRGIIGQLHDVLNIPRNATNSEFCKLAQGKYVTADVTVGVDAHNKHINTIVGYQKALQQSNEQAEIEFSDFERE